MPVHEVRYRAYEGPLLDPLLRLSAVPRYAVEASFNKLVGIALFGFGSVAIIFATLYLYISNSPALQAMDMWKQVPDLGIDFIFSRLLFFQAFPSLVVLVLAAPPMISPDLRHKALAILFARPLSRMGYIGGKLVALMCFTGYLTAFQVMLLTLLMAGFYPGDHVFYTEFFGTTLPLFAKALFCGLALSGTLSVVALACSAATKNRIFSAALFLILYAGSAAFSVIAGNLFRTGRWYFGLLDTTYDLSRVLLEGSTDRSLLMIIMGLGFWWVVSLGFLALRLRPVEVYKE